MSEIRLVFSSKRRSSWTPRRGNTCPESPCVWQSQSGPRCPVPRPAVCPQPTLLVTSVAAASSWLEFCPIHPCSAQTCPISLRRALTAAESVSSSTRWGRGARDPWSLQAHLFPGPLDLPVLETQTWRWKPAPSPLSTRSACYLLAARLSLSAAHIPPDYTDPPSPRPLLGGEHASFS